MSPGYESYTVDKSGTALILIRGSYVNGQDGYITISHDGRKILDWHVQANPAYYNFTKYTEHIDAGTHRLTGTVSNNIDGMITGPTSIFVLFVPD